MELIKFSSWNSRPGAGKTQGGMGHQKVEARPSFIVDDWTE